MAGGSAATVSLAVAWNLHSVPSMSLRCLATSAARKSRNTRTRGEWRRSGWVRSQRSAANSGLGGPRRTSPGRRSAMKQGRWPMPRPCLDRLGQAEDRVHPVADPLRRDVLVHELHRLEGREVVAEGHPVALVEALRVDGLRVRELVGAAVERPGDAGDAPADEVLRRVVGGADRHVGIALRQVQRLVGQDDVEAHVVALLRGT